MSEANRDQVVFFEKELFGTGHGAWEEREQYDLIAAKTMYQLVLVLLNAIGERRHIQKTIIQILPVLITVQDADAMLQSEVAYFL